MRTRLPGAGGCGAPDMAHQRGGGGICGGGGGAMQGREQERNAGCASPSSRSVGALEWRPCVRVRVRVHAGSSAEARERARSHAEKRSGARRRPAVPCSPVTHLKVGPRPFLSRRLPPMPPPETPAPLDDDPALFSPPVVDLGAAKIVAQGAEAVRFSWRERKRIGGGGANPLQPGLSFSLIMPLSLPSNVSARLRGHLPGPARHLQAALPQAVPPSRPERAADVCPGQGGGARARPRAPLGRARPRPALC